MNASLVYQLLRQILQMLTQLARGDGAKDILEGPSREELRAALAERDAVIAVLRVEIEALKRRLGTDSSNSSMPPAFGGPAARARRAKQRRCNAARPKPAGQALLDARAAVAMARAGGATALDADLLASLRSRYDHAVGWGILTNRDREWLHGPMVNQYSPAV